MLYLYRQFLQKYTLQYFAPVKNQHTFVCTQNCSLSACIKTNLVWPESSIFHFPHNYKRESLNLLPSFLRDCCTYLASSRRYGCADFFAYYPYVMNASKPHSLGSFCNSFLSEGKRRVIVTHFCEKIHQLWPGWLETRPRSLSFPRHMPLSVQTYKMCVCVLPFFSQW